MMTSTASRAERSARLLDIMPPGAGASRSRQTIEHGHALVSVISAPRLLDDLGDLIVGIQADCPVIGRLVKALRSTAQGLLRQRSYGRRLEHRRSIPCLHTSSAGRRRCGSVHPSARNGSRSASSHATCRPAIGDDIHEVAVILRNWLIDITSSISGWIVTRTPVAADSADMVKNPSCGGQSITTTSYRSSTCASASFTRKKNNPALPRKCPGRLVLKLHGSVSGNQVQFGM